MSIISLVSLLALLCSTSYGAALGRDAEAWTTWKIKFSKSYSSNEDESERYALWRQNVATIAAHNLRYDLGLETYWQTVNAFTDLTHEEFIAKFTFEFDINSDHGMKLVEVDATNNLNLPGDFDWRKKGAVTSVKDQSFPRDCGSCYAFSACGALEGQYKNKTGKLIDLSEQQLVSCSMSYGNDGCQGGLPINCYMYLQTNKMESASSYPYIAQDGTCKYEASKGLFNTGETVYSSTWGDEEALKVLLFEHGPVSLGIDAMRSLSYYGGGVYRDALCSTHHLNHAVLAVGYGSTDKGDKYWIIKNSWGKSFGYDGYFLLARDDDNMCGVASEANVPTIV